LNFPHTHPFFRGGFEPSSPYVKGADVILGIGCNMFVQTTFSPEPDMPREAKVVHFHSNPHELARMYPEEVSVLTDAKKGIGDLIEALKPLLTEKLKKTIQGRKKALKADRDTADMAREEEIATAWDRKPISLLRLVRELKEAVRPDAIIVDEAIRSSRALLKHYIFEHPGTYHRSCAGVLGWGVPAALGVKMANPGRQVVAFVGDGGFTFSVQSLWTAARYNIPAVIVICNNRQYRAVKDACTRYKGNSSRTGNFVGTDIVSPEIDFCRLASGFGVWAKKVSAPEKLKPALREALNLGKPAVIEVLLASS
jgi:benzoylformate decarboxylase